MTYLRAPAESEAKIEDLDTFSLVFEKSHFENLSVWVEQTKILQKTASLYEISISWGYLLKTVVAPWGVLGSP